MVTKIRKWGNSLGVRVPKAAADEAGVKDGSEVDVGFKDGAIVLRPVRKRKFVLEDLLSRVHPGNIHAETWPDEPKGKESL